MATLHAYVDKDGYYVRHSFATGGKLYHVIYQTTEAAVQRLKAQGVRDGDSIPKGLLHELISVGDLFTGKTGAGSTGLNPEPTKALDDSDIDLSSLSVEARKWFGLMMICHPSGKVSMETFSNEREGINVEVNGLPDNYIEQLFFIARRFDGTAFFENLRLSCKHLPPEANFRIANSIIGAERK